MSNRQSRDKTMTLNLLFILLMFLVTCGAELCEPVAKSRCCDPLVWVFCFLKIFSFFGINYFAECLKYDRVLIPDMICHCYCRTAVTDTPSTPSSRTSRSAPRCSTSAGGGAADGRLCGNAKTVTPLKVEMTPLVFDWSCYPVVIFWATFLLQNWFVSGCPVRQQSCNTTSSDPDTNNVLAKETAYTFSMCSGIRIIH